MIDGNHGTHTHTDNELIVWIVFFQSDMVYQQIRALAIHDTVVSRQQGFPQRICFQEFLRR